MINSDLKKILAVFCPSASTTDEDMFVGREIERIELSRALLAPGRHVVVFGGRGVGKTSTAKLVAAALSKSDGFRCVEYRCCANDRFVNIAFKVLSALGKLTVSRRTSHSHEDSLRGGLKALAVEGALESKSTTNEELFELVHGDFTPDRFVSCLGGQRAIVMLDEFDRVQEEQTKLFLADTLKSLSDYGSNVKMIISGVSNSSTELIGLHESNLRNIKSIRIPAMIPTDLLEIINRGLGKLHLEFSQELKAAVVSLSCGLPYFTHLLSEELAVHAFSSRIGRLELEALLTVLPRALENVADSISSAYDYALRDTSLERQFVLESQQGTPPYIKRFVLHSAALSPNGSFEAIAHTANRLIGMGGPWISEKHKHLDQIDVEVIIGELVKDSRYLTDDAGSLKFESPFLRAFTLMKALHEYRETSLDHIRRIGDAS